MMLLLTIHPAFSESAFSEYIIGYLDSFNLKCLKQTTKSMCLYVDRICYMTSRPYYARDPVTRNNRKLVKTSLILIK